MKAAASALLFALLVQDPACDHGTRGATRPVDLKEIARLHEETVRAFNSFSFLRPDPLPASAFDSGLPSCRSRTVRRVRVEPFPSELSALYFGAAGSESPPDAIHVVTRARSRADASIPADPELVARFGVRCAPTLVRPVSATEVELSEGESR